MTPIEASNQQKALCFAKKHTVNCVVLGVVALVDSGLENTDVPSVVEVSVEGVARWVSGGLRFTKDGV